MKEFTYIIKDPEGIHARPAGQIVKLASSFASKCIISKDGKEADLKRILAVMSLGCKKDQEIKITVEGEDEDAAAEAIRILLSESL